VSECVRACVRAYTNAYIQYIYMILTLPAHAKYSEVHILYMHAYLDCRYWSVKVRSRESLSYFMSPYATSVCGFKGRYRESPNGDIQKEDFHVSSK
jgi:hypothetical protein